MIQLNNGNKKILQIAIPSIVSNITVPLLGLIDVTIVGHLGSAAYIGAIAVGGMLFNIIYWIFGFLRMGTSGMTSQAYGRHDLNEVTRLLLRSVGVGLFIAFTLLALQYPIERIAFTFIQTTEEVEHLASLYFYICIWGAPAVLGLYSFAGWYIGMQNSRFPMYIAITQNIVNIAVSLLLVYGLGMKIEGVAIGTLTAQYAGLVMAYLLWLRYYSTLRKRIEWHSFFDKQAMYRFFQVNRDIFFRTICLVAVTVFFTSAGAAQGEVAKDRLKLLLVSDRSNCSPETMELIKNDIIQVISKYMEIDPEGLDIQITQSSEESEGPALYANIPIRELRK